MTDEPRVSARPYTSDWDEWHRQVNVNYEQIDWAARLSTDVDMMGRLVADLLKLDDRSPPRPGPRPRPDEDRHGQRLSRILGDDYATVPFAEAASALIEGKSQRYVARRTGIPKSALHRLLNGQQFPEVMHMRLIAETFDRPVDFFLEFRLIAVCGLILNRTQRHPEASIAMWRALSKGDGPVETPDLLTPARLMRESSKELETERTKVLNLELRLDAALEELERLRPQ